METPRPDEGGPRAWRGRLVEFGVIFAFWTFLAVLTVAGRIQDPRFEEAGEGALVRAALSIFAEYYLWALLTPLVFWLSHHFHIERTRWASRLLLHLGLGLLVAIGVELSMYVFRYTVLTSPRTHAFPFAPLLGIQRFWFVDEFIVYFAVLAAGFARDYFVRYRARLEEATRLRAEAARLQAELAEARLQALRMQVNPHFLFNTLHAVSSLVERDPQGVRRMIARLSTLLRYTLERSTTQEVPLDQELAFLRSYLEIQQIRFQGHLEVVEAIAPDVLDALVPNLILQPLVENAVKHGVSQVVGTGRLVIAAHREGEHLRLRVADNGPGLGGDGVPDLDRGVGLSNTRARLESLYGSAQALSFGAADGGGLAVEIVLPYHTAADLHAAAVLSA